MSLVILLIIEFVGWIAFNHITPFSIPRVVIALGVTTGSAAFTLTYASVFEPPFVDMMNIWTFALLNAIVALSISFVSFTRGQSYN